MKSQIDIIVKLYFNPLNFIIIIIFYSLKQFVKYCLFWSIKSLTFCLRKTFVQNDFEF